MARTLGPRRLFSLVDPLCANSALTQPLLYNLATTKSWSKIHSGLLKMYEGEVLAKRVVVQHLFVGGLIGWEIESDEAEREKEVGGREN